MELGSFKLVSNVPHNKQKQNQNLAVKLKQKYILKKMKRKEFSRINLLICVVVLKGQKWITQRDVGLQECIFREIQTETVTGNWLAFLVYRVSHYL